MKTRMVHGAVIETATPDEIARLIQGAIIDSQRSPEYTREKGSVLLSAAGAFSGSVADVPPSYDWSLERVTVVGLAAAIVNFWEGDSSGPNLLESIVIPASGFYSDAFSNNIYLPALAKLILSVSGGAANGQVTFNLQVRMIKRPQ